MTVKEQEVQSMAVPRSPGRASARWRLWLSRFLFVSSLLLVGNLIYFVQQVVTSEELLRVQYIPDDGYYYLALARNFARLGRWTFDSGYTAASGFHPLFAYLLAGVARFLPPEPATLVTGGVVLSALPVVIAALIACIIALRRRRPIYFALLILFLSSRSVLINMVSVVEWGWVVLAVLLYTICFQRALAREGRLRAWALGLFLLGVLVSLARSDAGLFPLAMLVATIVFYDRSAGRRAPLLAFAGFLGAATGVLLVLAHTYAISGQFFQASARVKFHWAAVSAEPFELPTYLLPRLVGLSTTEFSFAFIVLAAAVLLVLRRYDWRLPLTRLGGRFEVLLLVAACFTIMGYLLFYAGSGAVQIWYTANLVVPLFLCLALLVDWLEQLMPHPALVAGFALLTLVFAIQGVSRDYPLANMNAPWPHQRFMFTGGKYLADQELNYRVGSWNAGILGYYQGGTITNLDGLVNDEVYPYIVSGRLSAYVAQENLRYIIDFERLVDDERYRRRGGYDDPVFLDRLRPVRFFGTSESWWGRLTLYELVTDEAGSQ